MSLVPHREDSWGDLWTQGKGIPAGWLLEWQRVGRGAPPDSPCYFFVTIPKATF